jgi:hypothetical protein
MKRAAAQKIMFVAGGGGIQSTSRAAGWSAATLCFGLFDRLVSTSAVQGNPDMVGPAPNRRS